MVSSVLGQFRPVSEVVLKAGFPAKALPPRSRSFRNRRGQWAVEPLQVTATLIGGTG